MFLILRVFVGGGWRGGWPRLNSEKRLWVAVLRRSADFVLFFLNFGRYYRGVQGG